MWVRKEIIYYISIKSNFVILYARNNSFQQNVQILLNSFNASQKRHADNRIEIIRQLNQLPIHKQYELHLKNGKTKIVDKLTPLLIGKTQIMNFYDKL